MKIQRSNYIVQQEWKATTRHSTHVARALRNTQRKSLFRYLVASLFCT